MENLEVSIYRDNLPILTLCYLTPQTINQITSSIIYEFMMQFKFFLFYEVIRY